MSSSKAESSSDHGRKQRRVHHIDRKGSTSRRRKKQPFRGNIHTRPLPQFSYAIMDTDVFAQLAKALVCKTCKSSVKIERGNHQGLAFNLKIICPECGESDLNSSPTIPETRQKDVNLRATLAMRMLGHGIAGLQTFCGFMCLDPPVTQKTHETYNKSILAATQEVAKRSMARAAEREVELTGSRDITVPGDGG